MGALYVFSAVYLTLLVSFVVTLLEVDFGPRLFRETLRRWGKFGFWLVVGGLLVQILTWFAG